MIGAVPVRIDMASCPIEELRAALRTAHLKYLAHPEMRLLLRLAHDQGLLAGLLREAGVPMAAYSGTHQSSPLSQYTRHARRLWAFLRKLSAPSPEKSL